MNPVIVIPAYNECGNIPSVVRGAAEALPAADVLVVDDGSTDGTAQAATQAGAVVLQLPFNSGYGAALQTGFLYAAERDYDALVHLDADGQHDPQSIPDLLERMVNSDADVVVGSRFTGQAAYRLPFARMLGIRLMRGLVRLTTGLRISDPTSGFQALSRRAVELYCSEAYPADYPDADLLITAHRSGLTITEAPVTMHPRNSGGSMHSGMKPVWYMLKVLLSIGVTLIRKPPGANGS